MIKKLIILLTLLMVVRVDAATTVYGPAQTGTQRLALPNTSGSGVPHGFDRRSIKSGMLTDGSTILIHYGRYATTSAWTLDLLTSTDFGGTWTTTSNYMEAGFNLNPAAPGLYSFGDSTYMTSSNTSSSAQALRIALYRGATQIYLDSQILGSAMRYGTHSAAVIPLGTTRIFGITQTEGSPDSTHTFYASGTFSEAVTYTVVEGATTVTANGLRVGFTWSGGSKGAVLYYDHTNDDVFIADSASGMNTASDASWLDYAQANTAMYERYWICQIADSLGMVVWEQDTVSADYDLLYRTFYITGTATGSPGISTVASGTIVAGDNVTSGAHYTPTLSTIWGTDSVVCYYKTFEGADRLQPYIAYQVWDGSAWGSEQTYYNPSTPTDTIAYMQAPPRIYNISGTIKQMVCYADSVGTTNNDTLRIALGYFETGAAPSAPTTNTVIRSAVIRGAVIR